MNGFIVRISFSFSQLRIAFEHQKYKKIVFISYGIRLFLRVAIKNKYESELKNDAVIETYEQTGPVITQ